MKKNPTVTERLKQARKSKGLTQKYMSAKLGITREAFSRIETGRVEITSKHLVKIADILDISLDWLFFGKGEQTKQGFVSDFGKNAGAVEILFKGIKENEILLHDIISFYFEKIAQEKRKISKEVQQVESGK